MLLETLLVKLTIPVQMQLVTSLKETKKSRTDAPGNAILNKLKVLVQMQLVTILKKLKILVQLLLETCLIILTILEQMQLVTILKEAENSSTDAPGNAILKKLKVFVQM